MLDTAAGQGAFVSDISRWEAVQTRNRSADGVFYYSVSTTGIYCRPSCASRLPRVEHVMFHMSCDDAEAAGFRPCKKCRPNEELLYRSREAVMRACRLIENAAEAPVLADLAQAVKMSPFHFHRQFKMLTGVTPKAYERSHRARRLQRELSDSQSIAGAAYGAGFQSSSRFYALSLERLGMTPSTFKKGAEGASIRFATAPCSLGHVLVAAHGKKVCAILLGATRKALADDLKSLFPKATLSGAEDDFALWLNQIVSFVENPCADLNLPLDIRGTAFQERVWKALQNIPLGQTASYSAVARQIGAPKAVRAVAQACAANKICLAIPCHRVIREDGSLSGYRWGVERKRQLLEREASSPRRRRRKSAVFGQK